MSKELVNKIVAAVHNILCHTRRRSEEEEEEEYEEEAQS